MYTLTCIDQLYLLDYKPVFVGYGYAIRSDYANLISDVATKFFEI